MGVPMMDEQTKETTATEEQEQQVEENELDAATEEQEVLEPVNELQAEIDEISAEKAQLEDRLLRVQAEYDNYKRRTEKERVAERKYKSQDLANELLPVMDNFERALHTTVTEENKGFLEGIQMVYNQLENALKSEGIVHIETENKPFDPNMHHAVMQVEDENFESNVVVEELQKGYLLKDKVIRPAMVKVNK